MAIIKKAKLILKGPKDHEIKDAHTRSAPISFRVCDDDGEELEEMEITLLQLTWNALLVDGTTVFIYQIIAVNADGEDVCGEYSPHSASPERGLLVHHMKVEEPRRRTMHHIYQ